MCITITLVYFAIPGNLPQLTLPTLDILFGLFFFNGFFKKIYFWLHWVFVAVHRLPLAAESGGYSSLWCVGFSLQWLLLLWSSGFRHVGFSSCVTWAQQLWLMGSRVQAQQLWHTGLVAPWQVGSSQTRAQTRVPCIGKQILNHCAPREALLFCLQLKMLFKVRVSAILVCYSIFLGLSHVYMILSLV